MKKQPNVESINEQLKVAFGGNTTQLKAIKLALSELTGITLIVPPTPLNLQVGDYVEQTDVYDNLKKKAVIIKHPDKDRYSAVLCVDKNNNDRRPELFHDATNLTLADLEAKLMAGDWKKIVKT